ncbi:hypothetical protein IWW38_001494 [Coemansia aciculifera]|uniref:Uncharacterized protein n=1 Tax=Coemansia aciculifera TaxID=417176 RepID=A0ACC1M6L8_9FUNG|nr:hypothetical protein IWW38_001494 [Coemansia aciculifera]
MIYSNLSSLTLETGVIPYEEIWTVFEDVEPFPALVALTVSGGYPFDDDMLYRGNGRTMKSLCLPYSALVKSALGRFGVLKGIGTTQMDWIFMGSVTDADLQYLAAKAE